MKVVDTTTPRDTVPLSTVEPGEAFRHVRGVYVRLRNNPNYRPYGDEEPPFTAYNVYGSCLSWFGDDVQVTPLSAELHVSEDTP